MMRGDLIGIAAEVSRLGRSKSGHPSTGLS